MSSLIKGCGLADGGGMHAIRSAHPLHAVAETAAHSASPVYTHCMPCGIAHSASPVHATHSTSPSDSFAIRHSDGETCIGAIPALQAVPAAAVGLACGAALRAASACRHRVRCMPAPAPQPHQCATRHPTRPATSPPAKSYRATASSPCASSPASSPSSLTAGMAARAASPGPIIPSSTRGSRKDAVRLTGLRRLPAPCRAGLGAVLSVGVSATASSAAESRARSG